jgi:hypothetical protein
MLHSTMMSCSGQPQNTKDNIQDICRVLGTPITLLQHRLRVLEDAIRDNDLDPFEAASKLEDIRNCSIELHHRVTSLLSFAMLAEVACSPPFPVPPSPPHFPTASVQHETLTPKYDSRKR